MAAAKREGKTPKITIAGDIVIDHHLYEGERRSATSEGVRGVAEVREAGGAALIAKLLTELRPRSEVALGTSRPPLDRHGNLHAFAVWKPTPREPNAKPIHFVWRAGMIMGFGQDGSAVDAGHSVEATSGVYRPEATQPPPTSGVLVLDDAGVMFRHRQHRACWLLPASRATAPDWIVLKTAAPVAQGDLWSEVIRHHAHRLVCIVSANDLRREHVKLGAGLSWERTLEDLRAGLETTPALRGLQKCRHLIVTFALDGALWIDRTEREVVATLICDAAAAEGEFERRYGGKAFGYLSCMAASVANVLSGVDPHAKLTEDARETFERAVSGGLDAMRSLLADGHGDVSGDSPSGFPAERLARVISSHATEAAKESYRLKPAVIRVPWSGNTPPVVQGASQWMIVEMSQRPLAATTPRPSLTGLARMVVLRGPQVLDRIPHAVFGKLLTADRSEIEALRSIQRAMQGYDDERQPKHPLSIGVFGPPGAGKSFGVKELATDIYGANSWLEFNLSQFREADLIGAFHQVRDLVLSGVTPVVFWDEFDSGEYQWLRLLLAPMQDSRFQEGQITHALGKCVFVFAGGTSKSFGEFESRARDPDHAAREKYHMAKGPDFVSRLDQYYNVLGPNQRTLPPKGGGAFNRRTDPADVCHPLRRAILVRSYLSSEATNRVAIDSDLLDALLQVPTYRHGARSLEKLVKSLRPDSDGVIRRSALPPARDLDLHVDAVPFLSILSRNTSFRLSQATETIASVLHGIWRSGSKPQDLATRPHLDLPYGDLAEPDKEDNRAAARRIPEVLSLAGLRLIERGRSSKSGARNARAVEAHIRHHLERLAESEHDGWMEHKLRMGWQYAKNRDNEKKQHNLLVPYAGLAQAERDKDRETVMAYPRVAALAGYQIRPVEDQQP